MQKPGSKTAFCLIRRKRDSCRYRQDDRGLTSHKAGSRLLEGGSPVGPRQIAIFAHAISLGPQNWAETIREASPNDSTAMIVIMNRSAGGSDDPRARVVELFRTHGANPRVVQPNG